MRRATDGAFINGGALINTPLQRGAERTCDGPNRFNGFLPRVEPVETVCWRADRSSTPLKRGVNERTPGGGRSLKSLDA
jgi:hypothetical protein